MSRSRRQGERLDLDDMVAAIVQNVTGKKKQTPPSPEVEAPKAPKVARSLPRWISRTRPSEGEEIVEGDEEGAACGPHMNFELYLTPCLRCNQFCNCSYTYFPKQYPDVLVRSLDKKIVRLSKDMVRASTTLSCLVEQVLGKGKGEGGPGKAAAAQLKEEKVVIKTEFNESGGIVGYRKVEDDEKVVDFVSPSRAMTPAQAFKEAIHRANREEDFNDLFDFRDQHKLLVLFDTESDSPTLGILKETLTKIDFYICRHLDEVDNRVEAKRRLSAFQKSRYEKSRFDIDNHHLRISDFEDEDEGMLNTFAWEDWEEEFFDVDPVDFFTLHQANQDLLIWDLYWPLEKWIMLRRGFPKLMVNGRYDHDLDLEHERGDKHSIFGLYNCTYSNPRRKSHHRYDRSMNMSEFNRVGFRPRWWSINMSCSAPSSSVRNE